MRLLPEILTLAAAQLYLSAPWLRPELQYHAMGLSAPDQLKPLPSATSAKGPRAGPAGDAARGWSSSSPLLGIVGLAAAVGIAGRVHRSSLPRPH